MGRSHCFLPNNILTFPQGFVCGILHFYYKYLDLRGCGFLDAEILRFNVKLPVTDLALNLVIIIIII